MAAPREDSTCLNQTAASPFSTTALSGARCDQPRGRLFFFFFFFFFFLRASSAKVNSVPCDQARCVGREVRDDARDIVWTRDVDQIVTFRHVP